MVIDVFDLRSSQRERRRVMKSRIIMLLAAGLGSLAVAACGDGEPSENASNASAKQPASAESAGLAEAKKVVDQWREPSHIGLQEELAAPPPKGKTIVYLRCGVQDCTDI